VVDALEHLSERALAQQLNQLVAIGDVVALGPGIALVALPRPPLAAERLLGAVLSPVVNFLVAFLHLCEFVVGEVVR